jgi:hypothetical protein
MMSEDGYKKTCGATLKIHCPGLLGFHTKIELDGMDISHCCEGIHLSLAVDEINRVTLKILVSDLEVSAETLVMLQAYLTDKKQTA